MLPLMTERLLLFRKTVGVKELSPLEPVRGFATGDRVEVIDDIGHHFQSHIGIVRRVHRRALAVAAEIDVLLADGSAHRFFDFQLRTPPLTRASLTFDSTIATGLEGTRGPDGDRHMQFLGENFGLHVRTTEEGNVIHGQVTSFTNLPENPLVILLIDSHPRQHTTTDGLGEFEFEAVPPGMVTIEVFIPGRRMTAALLS